MMMMHVFERTPYYTDKLTNRDSIGYTLPAAIGDVTTSMSSNGAGINLMESSICQAFGLSFRSSVGGMSA